jgi:hypothetical protein
MINETRYCAGRFALMTSGSQTCAIRPDIKTKESKWCDLAKSAI